MSHISIAQRFCPFSHLPGSSALLPGSALVVRAYPTRLELRSLEGETLAVRDYPVVGPVKEFTLQQDLEKGHIRVWGKTADGFFRYRIHATADGAQLVAEKGPMETELLLGTSQEIYTPPALERIAFGDHHKQDWEGVKRRNTLAEILPFWFHLSQHTPSQEGTLFSKNLAHLFQAGFSGILVPQTADPLLQGIPVTLPEVPLLLLTEGGTFIRSLLLQETEGALSLVPGITRELQSGRALGLRTKWGVLDMEWRSGKLRRVALEATKSGTLSLVLPKEIKRFRVNGVRQDAGSHLSIAQGERAELDRFEK